MKFLALLLLITSTILLSMNPISGDVKSGFIATQSVDEQFPSISPNGMYILYTISDGRSNPMVIFDTASRKDHVLRSSVVSVKMGKMKFSMEGAWRGDSEEFAFVSFLSDPEILVFKVKGLKGKELGLKGSAEFMPSLSRKGKVAFVSNMNSQVDIYVWNKKVERITYDKALEFYPKWINDKIAYVKYDLGQTYLVIGKEKYKFKDGQLESEYPSPSGKNILVIANVSEFRSDLYIFSNGIFKKVDDDILERSVFWLDDKTYGYVKKSMRSVLILRDLKDHVKFLEPVKGYSIESVSASMNGRLAIAVFNPKNTSTDIYLYRLVTK